jgi:Tfp pilus assembly protein PilZ
MNIRPQKSAVLIKERRRYRRRPCIIPADCVIDGHSHQEFIVDISSTGAFIESQRAYFRGQEIKLTFPHPLSNEDITVGARVAWAGSHGFGVRFKRLEQKEEEISPTASSQEQRNSIGTVKKATIIGKIRQKKIRWESSASSEVVGYKLYWSEDEELNYDSKSVEVGNVTEVILPSGIPSFPLIKGRITLGISAVNKAGNESDITKMTAELNFIMPDALKGLRIKDILDSPESV